MSSVVASEIMPSESLASDTDRVWLRRTSVEETPRRPRIIMEGPLVSDTTEVLSGAASASEESPIGHPAADPAGAAPRSSSRSGGGDLSKLLVSDLQRIAQELGISGTGRMRKGDLVAAIQERTGGGRSTARSASQSATRGTSAGADAPRPLNQDAMEADTSVRSGIGEAAPAAGRGIGDVPSSAGVGDAERAVSVAAQQAAPSVESHSGAVAGADAPAEAGTESPGQDGRRERTRNRRRDDQGNGRDRRERSDNRGEGRDNREPAAAGNGRGGQNTQGSQGGNAGGQGGGSRPDSRDSRSDSRDTRPDSRSDSRDTRPDNRADDDDDRSGRRGRDRFRNRNRRRGDRQGGEPEAVIAEDDVRIPIAGILDVLENYAFVRTTGYLPGSNDVYVSLSQVRKHGLRK